MKIMWNAFKKNTDTQASLQISEIKISGRESRVTPKPISFWKAELRTSVFYQQNDILEEHWNSQITGKDQQTTATCGILLIFLTNELQRS